MRLSLEGGSGMLGPDGVRRIRESIFGLAYLRDANRQAMPQKPISTSLDARCGGLLLLICTSYETV